jgi:hypothetical protein
MKGIFQTLTLLLFPALLMGQVPIQGPIKISENKRFFTQHDGSPFFWMADTAGTYAMIYFPTGKVTEIDFSILTINKLKAEWFDPRTGVKFPYSGDELTKGKNRVLPPSQGKGNDWVLIVN